jgi:DNA modification methylase
MAVQFIVSDVMDGLRDLLDESVHCVVTSPPYFGLRDYDVAGQIGLEETPEAYTARMVEAFREVRRVLRPDGTLWLNLGDSYNAAGRKGHGRCVGAKQGTNRASAAGADTVRVNAPNLKEKNLIGIPWRVAFALQADGWYLRQDIIWHKPNPMPESVRDRCTKAHEYIFLMSKSPRYYFDAEAISEAVAPSTVVRLSQDVAGQAGSDRVPGETNGTMKAKPPRFGGANGTRNRRSVWTVTTQPYSGAHFATFPPALIEPCVLAGCPVGGTVLDPFGGAGTTALVAGRLKRDAILIELNPTYAEMARRRIESDVGCARQRVAAPGARDGDAVDAAMRALGMA